MSVMKSMLLLIQTQKQHPFKKRFGCWVGASQFYYPGNSTSWGEREEAGSFLLVLAYLYLWLLHNGYLHWANLWFAYAFITFRYSVQHAFYLLYEFLQNLWKFKHSRPAFETINLRGHVNSNKNGST
ncbi:hypothetical protein RHSIM_Rhsim04G0116600 [Rhododendron simsii]|uniref:Uncharacterized protein n=1 Tax=Rhododendron simsii TaxID=118357 RepID=A0A834H0C6_RHOSS|nr:hypothetical protein RHSIM_Rhsim04G0116600 [Rhododendron simsii]